VKGVVKNSDKEENSLDVVNGVVKFSDKEEKV